MLSTLCLLHSATYTKISLLFLKTSLVPVISCTVAIYHFSNPAEAFSLSSVSFCFFSTHYNNSFSKGRVKTQQLLSGSSVSHNVLLTFPFTLLPFVSDSSTVYSSPIRSQRMYLSPFSLFAPICFSVTLLFH